MYCDWPQLGRCCFCMPLRRGVLTFGYIHIFVSAFMIGMYSYSVHYANTAGLQAEWLLRGRTLSLPSELCVTFFCFELIMDAVLIYGAHMKSLGLLKSYYYYTMTTCVALLVMEIMNLVRLSPIMGSVIQMAIFNFAGLCLQIYLITMVWSLIKKLEMSGPHVYDNQLHQIVNGDLKVEPNGIYNNTTVVPIDV